MAGRSATERIAVIIPCFNDGATVGEAVESARSQQPAELVVVDDGSNEAGTIAALADLERDGVRIVRQENAGLSAARMAGVRATTAPYVFPLDADDLVAAGALRPLAEALDSHPEAVVAWGDEVTFGNVAWHRPVPKVLDPWRITYLNEIPGGLIRREALLAVGGWQLRNGYEDWDLWMAFAERGWHGVSIDRVMLHYRIHGPRMLTATSVPLHAGLYRELQRRHARLFEQRRRNWRRSPAPGRMKLALPLISRLPVPLHGKHRLYHLATHPVRLPLLWLRRVIPQPASLS